MFLENNKKFLSLSAALKVPNGLKQVEKDTNKTLVSAPQVWTYFTPKHVLCTFFGKPAIFYGSSVVRYRDWQFILGFNSLLWGWTFNLWIRRCGALWVWTRLAKKSDFLVTHHTKTRKKQNDEKRNDKRIKFNSCLRNYRSYFFKSFSYSSACHATK